jgi:hypothetical protein
MPYVNLEVRSLAGRRGRPSRLRFDTARFAATPSAEAAGRPDAGLKPRLDVTRECSR